MRWTGICKTMTGKQYIIHRIIMDSLCSVALMLKENSSFLSILTRMSDRLKPSTHLIYHVSNCSESATQKENQKSIELVTFKESDIFQNTLVTHGVHDTFQVGCCTSKYTFQIFSLYNCLLPKLWLDFLHVGTLRSSACLPPAERVFENGTVLWQVGFGGVEGGSHG